MWKLQVVYVNTAIVYLFSERQYPGFKKSSEVRKKKLVCNLRNSLG